MYGHQNKVSDFFYEHYIPGAMAWLDVGSGKTVSALDTIARMDDDFSFNKLLVVSTKLIVDNVWPVEIKKWAQVNHLTITTRSQLLSVRRNCTDQDYLEAKIKSRKMGKIIRRRGKSKTPPERLKQYKGYMRLVRERERDLLKQFDTDVTLINVENFTWLATRYARQWPFDTVVFDECSLFRNCLLYTSDAADE